MERNERPSWSNEKEELYDVIAALADTLRKLTNEIIEMQGIYLQVNEEINRRKKITTPGVVE